MRTLPTNWRSDALLLDGLDAVFNGAALGDPRIRVLPVKSEHPGRMVDAAAPVRLRVLPRDGLTSCSNGTAKTGEAKDAVARDLAVEVVALLSGGPKLRPRDDSPERQRAARRHRGAGARPQAGAARAVVPARGRRAGRADREDRASSRPPAAEEWQLLLEALEQPHRTTRVRRLALSCFVGLNATELDARGDDVRRRPRPAAAGLGARSSRTVAWRRCSRRCRWPSQVQHRVLGQPDGERLLTDLRHIAQALHEAALEGQLGLTALLVWLRRRREEASREGGQERSRRLETDAAAVQVITVHTSKGLEFPVVMVPFAWDLFARSDPATAVFHDDNDHRVRDVGGPGSPDWAAHARKHKQEEKTTSCG